MIACCARPVIARAEGTDVPAAEALFEAGRKAIEKGDYASACPRFRESERLDPAPGTLLNLADCEEHLNHLARAWEAWKEALATLPGDDPRLPVTKQRVQAIEARVPHLTLTRDPAAPEGVLVRRDDVEIHGASFDVALPVDPGAHVITVTAPGRDSKTTTITLREGEARTFLAEPGPPAANANANADANANASANANANATFRTVGLITGAVGVVSLGVGSVFGAMAIGKKSTVDTDCGPRGCTQPGVDAAHAGRTDAIASDITFVAGGALVALGTVLFLTHLPAHGTANGSTGLVTSPLVLARGGGLALGGDF